MKESAVVRKRTTVLAAIVLGAGLSAACAEVSADDGLPITGITLYRSGVGYFERRGVIEGNADVQIQFSTDQINDILKSMVLLDLDGGKIEAASYGSKEPLARRLASFAVDISDNPDMAELLNRLRGARVSLTSLEGRISGAVIGVERRPISAGEQGVIEHPYVNLLTDTGIRSIDLTAVSSMQILDEKLASELAKALSALSEHRADNLKAVDLSFRGDGARRIVVAYVHEMPVWKTSYRLVLPDEAAGKPTLQGWAIVENTTDEDWNNVTLSLVAGQPVGFQMDLYQPLFLTRPQVPVPVTAGVAPRAFEGEVFTLDDERVRTETAVTAPGRLSPAQRLAGRGAAPEAPAADKAFMMDKTLDAGMMAEYAARAQASAGEIGQVFRYQLDQPVTIERRRSAMLPILSAAIEGERVSIFSPGDGLDHPMRGVSMTNTSGLELMPGPISVFDGATYAGDAQVGHISAGEERLLAYAVDLDVLVHTEPINESNITSLRIVNGLIEETRKSQSGARYTFRNNDKNDARTIVIEQPRLQGWDLVKPAEPESETNSVYRFRVGVGPGASSTFEVLSERTDRQMIAVTSYNTQTLLSFARQGKVSQEVVRAVQEAGRLQARVQEVDQQISRLEQERNEIAADQARVRDNMSRIDRNTDLYARYIQKLDEQETRLEQIAEQIESLRSERQRRQDEFNAYLRNLNVG